QFVPGGQQRGAIHRLQPNAASLWSRVCGGRGKPHAYGAGPGAVPACSGTRDQGAEKRQGRKSGGIAHGETEEAGRQEAGVTAQISEDEPWTRSGDWFP